MSIQRNILLQNSYQPAPSMPDGYVQDGCVLCFDGYQEPSGGVWKDLSGGGNDLILSTTAVHNTTYHFMGFSDNSSVTRGIVPLPTTATIEFIVGVSNSTQYIFQSSTSRWPYAPNMFFGGFLCVRYNQESNTGYVRIPNLIGKTISSDESSTPNFYQYSYATPGNCQVWNKMSGQNLSLSGPSTQTNESIIDSSDRLKVGSNGLRLHALRIYSRYLSDDELLQNRTLDITRYNL